MLSKKQKNNKKKTKKFKYLKFINKNKSLKKKEFYIPSINMIGGGENWDAAVQNWFNNLDENVKKDKRMMQIGRTLQIKLKKDPQETSTQIDLRLSIIV